MLPDVIVLRSLYVPVLLVAYEIGYPDAPTDFDHLIVALPEAVLVAETVVGAGATALPDTIVESALVTVPLVVFAKLTLL